MIKKIVYLIPAFIWMIVIISLSLQTGDVSGSLSGSVAVFFYHIIEWLGLSLSIDSFHLVIRKLAHFSEYFILGVFVYLALIPYMISTKQKCVYIFLVGIIFASVDETLQLFVHGRGGSVFDVLIDSLGILFSVVIINIWFLLRKKLKA